MCDIYIYIHTHTHTHIKGMHVDNKTWAKNSEKLKYKNVQKKSNTTIRQTNKA